MIRKVTLFIGLILSGIAFGQNNNASIYSFFGIGESNENQTVEQHNMAGTGISYSDNYHFNLSNPASLASLRLVNYGLGVFNKSVSIKNAKESQTTYSFSVSNLNLSFPLGQKGGFSIGIMPNSLTGYNLTKNGYNESKKLDNITIFEGKGGTNKIFSGIGYHIYKGISLGLHAEYLFGNTTKIIKQQQAGDPLTSIYKSSSNLRGFLFTAGLQGKFKINKKTHINFGMTFRAKNKLKDMKNNYIYSLGNNIPGDTIQSTHSTRMKTIPSKISMGVGIGEDYKWFAGIDYTHRGKYDFTLATLSNNINAKYTAYNRISVGGFYTPKFNSALSYWDRITYRTGFFYENTGLDVKSIENNSNFEKIKNYGITFGIELPTGNGLSNLSIGVELGRKGTTMSGLVQENYGTLRIGVSLNDKWFRKRKIF